MMYVARRDYEHRGGGREIVEVLVNPDAGRGQGLGPQNRGCSRS